MTRLGRRGFLAGAGLLLAGARRATAGGAGDAEVLALDRNENPLGPSPRVAALLAGAARWAARYPDAGARGVARALAAHHGVPDACVVPACGSLEAIALAMRELGGEGARVVTSAPVFHMLTALVGLSGAEVVPVPVDARGAPDLRALAAAAARAKIVFLATPHNPTGGAVTRRGIEELARALPERVTLVVDEAYLPYARGGEAQSAVALVGRVPRLIVLRTLSKAHGLAGLRVGCAIADANLAARLARQRLANGVGTPAQHVVEAALADAAHVTRVIDLNARARERLTRGMTRAGLTPFASEANFVLADAGPRAADMARRLAQRGILVHRPPDMQSGLRISTGTLEQMERVIDALSRP